MSQPRLVTRVPAAVAVVLALLGTLLATSLGALPASAASSDLTWSVKPSDGEQGTARPNFSYEVDPGQVIQDGIDVSNFGSAPLTLKVYAADAFTTSSGQLDLLPVDQPSTDVGAWVHLDTDEITVDPGQTVSVPFTVTVPDDARPGDHSGGVVTSYASAQSGTTVQLDRRLGSRMHVRVSGELEPAVTVSDVHVAYHHSWNPFGTSSATVSYTVSNTGNTRVAATDTVSVAGLFGWARTADRADDEEATDLPELLPGDEIPRRIEVTGVWPLLRATAEVQLTAEGVGLGGAPLPLIERTAGTWAVPWVLLALVVVVVVLALWGPGWWARRGRRTAAGPGATSGAPVADQPAAGTEPAPLADQTALEVALAAAREEGRREALRALEAQQPGAAAPAQRPGEATPAQPAAGETGAAEPAPDADPAPDDTPDAPSTGTQRS